MLSELLCTTVTSPFLLLVVVVVDIAVVVVVDIAVVVDNCC